MNKKRKKKRNDNCQKEPSFLITYSGNDKSIQNLEDLNQLQIVIKKRIIYVKNMKHLLSIRFVFKAFKKIIT
jgi:hypothetical protein